MSLKHRPQIFKFSAYLNKLKLNQRLSEVHLEFPSFKNYLPFIFIGQIKSDTKTLIFERLIVSNTFTINCWEKKKEKGKRALIIWRCHHVQSFGFRIVDKDRLSSYFSWDVFHPIIYFCIVLHYYSARH